MKAIVTTYRGPTNTRGARIWASDQDGNRVSIPYPHELSPMNAHIEAAQKLCDKLNWQGERAVGAIKRGYVHVFVEGR
jgi:hypothetical protein